MNIPKSNIWQDLRSQCLEAIPIGCRSLKNGPFTLRNWQENGAYSVTVASNKGFDIICTSTDIGSALLGDAEHLLDHATEHQISIWKQISNDTWASPAWLVVTFYYWAFFLSMGLSRLIGLTIWFLNRDITDNLKSMASISSNSAGQGSFKLKCGPTINSSERELSIHKNGTRIHDDVWRLFFNTTGALLRKYSMSSGSSLEVRLFTCFERSSFILGFDWPSALRNFVNYRPGFAYNTVRRVQTLDSFRYLRHETSGDIQNVIDRFESNIATVRSPDDILNKPKIVIKLLVDLTFLIYALTTELHFELLERNNIDRRWRDSRLKFVNQEGLYPSGKVWPL